MLFSRLIASLKAFSATTLKFSPNAFASFTTFGSTVKVKGMRFLLTSFMHVYLLTLETYAY
jgi:hypothetical protein